MKTKLNELLEFPTPFTFKIMGDADPDLVNEVISVIQKYAPGDYVPNIKPSSKGNYYSISVTIEAKNVQQIENLYEALSKINNVRMVL